MKTLTIKTLLILISTSLSAQTLDTIRVGDTFKNYRDLELGAFKELMYIETKGEKKLGGLVEKKVERIKIGNKEYLKFTHHITSGRGSAYNGGFYFLCEPGTLKPVIHIRTTGSKKEAFQFTDTRVVALDSAQNNSITDLNLILEVPTFNWQIDIETYSMLPMSKGYKTVMNFYHPGGDAPTYNTLEVIGDEKISLPNGEIMDCWILFTDYGGHQPSRFWYTKEGQNFIKMEGDYGKMKIRKVRLF